MKISLKIKSACILLAATLFLTGIAVGISYFVYRDSMNTYYENMTSNLAHTEAVTLDEERISRLTENAIEVYRGICEENGGVPDFADFTEEQWENYYARYQQVIGSDDYSAIMKQLNDLAEANDVSSIYVCYMDAETNKAIYIIDGDVAASPCPMGTCDDIETNNLALMRSGIYDFPAYITNYEEYGWLCTASAVIKDTEGNMIANAYVDISMEDVVQNRMNFLRYLCEILMIAAAIMAVLLIFTVNKTVVSPINALAQATESFVSDRESNRNGNQKSAISRLHIKTGDEIEYLTNAVQKMELEINDYIDNLTAVTAEKERIGAELDVAAHIQYSMLPCIFPPFPDRKEFDIYATMNPAKEVGGDFYDFFMVDERHLAIVMADVSGKGVPAALFMVIAKTLIKDHTQPGRDLGDVFTTVNNILCESNSEGLFVTAFEGVLDLMTGEFRFVNAGHEMPFIAKKGQTFEAYKIRPGFVLSGMENIRYKSASITLEPGDRIFQYTDGITEATNAENKLYGMDRLHDILEKHLSDTPTALLLAIKTDIDEFVGEAPQFDDITMLCLEYKEKMSLGQTEEEQG